MDPFAAAERGDLERVRALVEQDAGLVHATDTTGRTPLLWAAYGGRVDVVRYLLDHGATATINHRDPSGKTAPHVACYWGHTQVILLLLQWVADATAVDSDGATPLITAAIDGRDAIVRMLLEHGGSDVDAANHDGRTACHWACHFGHSGVLRQLLEAGADPTLREGQGRTATDLAAHYRRHNCVRTLQEWDRAYLLRRVRCLQDASSTLPSNAPQQGS